MLYLQLRNKRIDYLDEGEFQNGNLVFQFETAKEDRKKLETRLKTIRQRQRLVAASNRMAGHTDAANGVVPFEVAEDAVYDYREDLAAYSTNLSEKSH